MNIQPNTICMIVGGVNHNRLCTALYVDPDGSWLCEAMQTMFLAEKIGPFLLDARDFSAGARFNALACDLRPIGGPGADESLSWASIPTSKALEPATARDGVEVLT